MEKKIPAAPAPKKTPVLVRSRLRLHAVEDRLQLDGMTHGNQQLAFWLTRRLALQLFQGLRAQMEKGSPAGKQPSVWRDEALALEHAAILKSAEAQGAPKAWAADPKAVVLTNVGFKVLEGKIRIALFRGKQPLAVMTMQTPALHRLAAMLALRIQQAHWDRGLDLAWLGRPQAQQRPSARKTN